MSAWPGPVGWDGDIPEKKVTNPFGPSPLSRYELRCVVWNTRDVDLGDTNVAGQRMSDIYVTG